MVRGARRTVARAIALAFLFWTAGMANAAELLIDGVPIPDDAAVVAAPPGAPDAARRFLGAWVGAWDDVLRHILIVEEVRTDGSVQVVYAVGDNPAFGIARTFRRLEATLSGDTLAIMTGRFSARYILEGDNTLTASFQSGAIRSNARMAKVDRADLHPDASIAWSRRAVEFLDTDLAEAGKPLRLETVIFKPDGLGPFPLLVIHHGSTGAGTDPKLFKLTFWSFAIADFFTRRGWLVAFPQRRGRGNSDGLYDEGFAPDRREGYTCDPVRSLGGADRALEDVHAAMTALRARPDVDARRVLVGGQSRGGALSVAYAGEHPGEVMGVINFVGGWLGTGCGTASEVNGALLRRGGRFRGPIIWLYGRDDIFYPIGHSRQNFAAFESAGGRGDFFEFDVPAKNGHGLAAYPELWTGPVEYFIRALAAEKP